MSKCYVCGKNTVHKIRSNNYYCGYCDTVFYRATGTTPEGTPYYVLLDKWLSSGSVKTSG